MPVPRGILPFDYARTPAELARRIRFAARIGAFPRGLRLFGDVPRVDAPPGAVLDIAYGVKIQPGCLLLLHRPQARIELGKYVYLHAGVKILARNRVAIGEGTGLSVNVTILDSDFHAIDGTLAEGPVEIGERVWVGAGAMILAGVKIGDGAIIGAGSLVRDDVEPRTLVVGAPARPVRSGVSWDKGPGARVP